MDTLTDSKLERLLKDMIYHHVTQDGFTYAGEKIRVAKVYNVDYEQRSSPSPSITELHSGENVTYALVGSVRIQKREIDENLSTKNAGFTASVCIRFEQKEEVYYSCGVQDFMVQEMD